MKKKLDLPVVETKYSIEYDLCYNCLKVKDGICSITGKKINPCMYACAYFYNDYKYRGIHLMATKSFNKSRKGYDIEAKRC